MKVSEEWIFRGIFPMTGRHGLGGVPSRVSIASSGDHDRMLLKRRFVQGIDKYLYKLCIQFMIRKVEGGVGHGEGITRCRTGRLAKP